MTNSRFENPKRLTNANPQQAQFKWGHRILFDYKDKDGHKLQGTLAVPDDYQPGQKLPMLVYYYEKLSDQQNHYEVPRYATAPQYADYVSNGYLVLLPDIYFHTGRSHTDMLNSVEAAVKRVEDLGYADPKRVGLHGDSYSGQGGAYISTQSKMFAAIAIRAAAVDLIADFNQLWKTTGTNQHRYDTYGQGRFGTNPYDNLAAVHGSVGGVPREDDEHAAAHLAGHERRLDRVAAGRRVLQRAALPQEAGDLPLVRRRRRTASRATTISTTSKCACTSSTITTSRARRRRTGSRTACRS